MLKKTSSEIRPVTPHIIWGVRVIFFICLIIIVWKSIEPSRGKVIITHMDKVLHFGAYAVLCFVALKSNLIKNNVLVLVLVVLLGLSMEVFQGLMGWGRSASIADFVANTLGALTSFWIYRRLK